MAETIPAEAAPGAAAKESKGKHKAPKMELSGAQKAAAVIVALGAEKASLLYKYMEPDDVEQITLEVARLGYLDSKATEDVLTEFYQMCMTNKAVTEGGLEYARTVLEKAYGEQAAEDLLNKVTKSLKNREFAFMNKADVKSLYSALQNERPQTIALVLSYVDADKAAGVIAQLEEHKTIIYDYLCPFPEEYEKTYTPSEELTVPACTAKDLDFYVLNQGYFEDYSWQDIYDYCKMRLDNGAAVVRFKFGSQEAFSEACQELLDDGVVQNVAQYYMKLHGLGQVENHYGCLLYTSPSPRDCS